MGLVSKRNCTKHKKKGIGRALSIGLTRKSIFIAAALILIAGIGYVAYIKDTATYSPQMQLSYADCFVILDSTTSKVFYLIPIYLCLMMQLLHRDENIQVLIRQNSRGSLWCKRFYKIAMISLALSIYETITACIASGLLASTPINWDKEGSLFWLSSRGNRLSGDMIGIGMVVFTFFAVCLVTFVFIGSLFALCQWMTGNLIIGWIVSMGLGVYEYVPGPELFFKRVSIWFEKWIGGYPYIQVFAFSIILISGIFAIGFLVSKRKEFIGER